MPPFLSEEWSEISFSDLENWHNAHFTQAFSAFRRCAIYALEKPIVTQN